MDYGIMGGKSTGLTAQNSFFSQSQNLPKASAARDAAPETSFASPGAADWIEVDRVAHRP
jgi:hypothetical protein